MLWGGPFLLNKVANPPPLPQLQGTHKHDLDIITGEEELPQRRVAEPSLRGSFVMVTDVVIAN